MSNLNSPKGLSAHFLILIDGQLQCLYYVQQADGRVVQKANRRCNEMMRSREDSQVAAMRKSVSNRRGCQVIAHKFLVQHSVPHKKSPSNWHRLT